MTCNLEDMPSSFQEAVKKASGMPEDALDRIERNQDKVKKNVNEGVEKVEKISIYRKMFGYYKNRS